MRRLSAGEAGEVKVLWQDRTGKWIDRKGYHRKGKFRARVRVCDLAGEVHDVRVNADSPKAAENGALARVKALTTVASVSSIAASTRFVDVAEAYLAHLPTTNRAPRTVATYAESVRRYVLHPERACPLARVSVGHANDPVLLRDVLYAVDREHGPSAAKTLRSALAGLFDYAKARRAVAVNAVREIEPWRVPDAERVTRETKHQRDHDRAMTEVERAKLLHHVEQWAEPVADVPRTAGRPPLLAKRLQVADLLYVLALTGARFSEALTLRWEDLDLDRHDLHIRGTKTARSDRHVGVTPELASRLRQRKLASDTADREALIFPSPGLDDSTKPWETHNARAAVQAVINAAGFTWATPHTFRTTLATVMLDKGVPVRQVADWLGHEDVATTWRFYAGRSRDVSDAALQAVGVIGRPVETVTELRPVRLG